MPSRSFLFLLHWSCNVHKFLYFNQFNCEQVSTTMQKITWSWYVIWWIHRHTYTLAHHELKLKLSSIKINKTIIAVDKRMQYRNRSKRTCECVCIFVYMLRSLMWFHYVHLLLFCLFVWFVCASVRPFVRSFSITSISGTIQMNSMKHTERDNSILHFIIFIWVISRCRCCCHFFFSSFLSFAILFLLLFFKLHTYVRLFVYFFSAALH